MAEWVVLGSGTGIPTAARNAPGYLLLAGDERVLFDAGSGTLRRLAQEGVAPSAVSRVFLSHFHTDHTLDVIALCFALKSPTQDRGGELPIHAPDGFADLLARMQALYGHWIVPDKTRVVPHVMRPGEAAELPWGRVRAARTAHTPEALCYRIELKGGGTLTYSGDTGWSEDVARFAQGSDVFVLECAVPPDRSVPYHCNPQEVGRMARLSGVPRLVLTHLYPEVEPYDLEALVRKEYAGEVVRARDGMRVRVGG
jgi:ribonuclease BN (tRNA processing enzyme)